MPENLNGSPLNGNGASSSETQDNEEVTEEEIHYDPILPLIDISTNEEDETELIKLRAKLYRYDSINNPAEWKERGTGEIKLLRHNTKNTVRVVMRRDKTLKICANHFVTPWMELKPNCGSDRAWVWSVLADFADELLKPELLAIKFANADNAKAWKEAFDKAKIFVGENCEIYTGKSNPREDSDGASTDVSYSESDQEESSKEKKDKTEEKQDSDNKDTEKKDKDDSDQIAKDLEKLNVTKEN